MPRLTLQERINRNRKTALEIIRGIPTDSDSGCRVWDGEIRDGLPWSKSLGGDIRRAVAGVPLDDLMEPEMLCTTPNCVEQEHISAIDYRAESLARTAERMSQSAEQRWALYREAKRRSDPDYERRMSLQREHTLLIARMNTERAELDLPLIRAPRQVK